MATLDSSKLPGVGTSIFSVMTQLSADHWAINLAQGFPDFDCPARLRELVSEHLNRGHNQYAPLPGVLALREQVALKAERVYGRKTDPDTEVTIAPGATEAIYCALSAVVHPGDEVIVIDPAYDTYAPGILLNGGIPRRVPMCAPDFAIDWQKVADLVRPSTRVLMLNSPHNPSGRCFADEDIAALHSLLAKKPDLLLISDEVYEHIVFDGHPHMSLLRYPELAQRAFVISSFGKIYHVTGWRVGYCIAPEALTREFRLMHQIVHFSANAPISHALADFMHECRGFADDLARFYQEKRDLFGDLMTDTRFDLTPTEGTYFQCADYSNISDLPDTEFARELTIRHKVAAIPVSVFYESPPDTRIVRFCFAKEDATLREATSRLRNL